MNAIIDLCHQIILTIRSPRGHYWILLCAIIVIMGGVVMLKSQNPMLFIKRLFQLPSFRGRENVSNFRTTDLGMNAFLVIWIGCFVFLIGFSSSIWQHIFVWVGVIGVAWASLVSFSLWVRRCHDLGYSGWQAFWRGQFDIFTLFRDITGSEMIRFQVYWEKGEPGPNQFGPAPEENIPGVPRKEEVEFPEVWPGDPFEK